MMMKFFILILSCLLVSACSYGEQRIQKVMDDPIELLKDPLTVEHKQAMTDLEQAYLNEDITYAEYLEQKKQLEEDYTRQVQKREAWIEP